jgi:[ribosomal protein S5]-alanine N-acetyltransferase
MLPALTSSRLALTETAPGDLEDVTRLWNDRDVRRFLFDNRPISPDQARALVERMQAETGTGLGSWSVRRRSQPDIIGTAGLMPASTSAEYEPRLTGLIEPVIAIAPPMQRQGIAREALSSLLRHAFHTLGLDQVAAAVDVPNIASVRLVETFGFKLVSEVPGPVYALRTYTLPARNYRPMSAHA